jgi:hypothetical protein
MINKKKALFKDFAVVFNKINKKFKYYIQNNVKQSLKSLDIFPICAIIIIIEVIYTKMAEQHVKEQCAWRYDLPIVLI